MGIMLRKIRWIQDYWLFIQSIYYFVLTPHLDQFEASGKPLFQYDLLYEVALMARGVKDLPRFLAIMIIASLPVSGGL